MLLLVAALAIELCMERPSSRAFANRTSVIAAINGPDNAYVDEGDTLLFIASIGVVAGSAGPGEEFVPADRNCRVIARPDRRSAARMITTPLSLNWKHPLQGQPVAQVVRLAQQDEGGAWHHERMFTALFAHHGELPVLSLLASEGALFDPDTGLLVVGNAIFHAPRKLLLTEYKDPRWWKYPGNFHLRGKQWERRGRLQMIAPDGTEIFQRPVSIRVNGQMTRGFPQHALRIGFDEPLQEDVLDESPGPGYDGLVIRAAGNDQIKAMMRDVFQHTLCEGLPFEVSGHRTCVLYINGAYWGLHHLRPRMDEEELARRYDVPKKKITILEDEARFYRGDSLEVIRFKELADRTADWDGSDGAWADTLNTEVDVDGFLHYMASQMILANMDWPEQNVKFWKYTGKPKAERPLDGRWYFIMGDSDLGYGARSGPETDIFLRVNALDVPVTRLLKGMLRNVTFKAHFISIARGLARSRFSSSRSLAELERTVALMTPEMTRHTARWRRPADLGTWQEHVAVMRTFAARREAIVLEQLDRFERTVQ
ncbi:MAG: CotH kinase family protein [Flavobacteriales bacterium]|nr:CotH kinase family protein [Flavobacteriales bacterium]